MIFTPEQYQTLIFMFAASAILTLVSIVNYINTGVKFNENEEINMKSSLIPSFMCILTIILAVFALYPM